MIRIIYRNFSEKKLEEKKWDFHPAFFHYKTFKGAKAVYLNGLPLKWHNIFKNGDVIEVVYRPAKFFDTTFGKILGTVSFGILGFAAFQFAKNATEKKATPTATATPNSSQKEFSSVTQPELKGAQNDISESILPVLFGKTQQTPSYGQLPYRLVQDGSSTNKYRQYFIANYNNVVYSDFKLGETSVNDYAIDYLTITQESGSSNFIGFENCKAISVDEELSYNADEAVNQSSNHYYNERVTASSVTYAFQLKFSNVDINNWANKVFKSVITARKTVDGIDVNIQFENTYTITAASLTQSGNDYIYNGSYTYNTGSINYIVSSQFAPSEKTRGNSTENTNELDVILLSESITAGNFESDITLNTSVNSYLGSMSEVINTSPENTTEIDVIISFPQGLYSIDKSSGDRYSRSSTVEIMYKKEGGQWQSLSSANALYIRDVNGEKQPISSSTTTVNGTKVTVKSPNDLNIADQLFFRPIGFEVEKGKYSVRVRSADFSDKTNYDIGYPHCSEIQFRVEGDIVNPDILPKVNQIAFEATAYKGLSGTLKKFNYIGEALIPIWNGENWETIAKTTNPAAVIRYLLTDNFANPRAISPDLIDNDSLVEYFNWCENEGYQASGVISESIKTLDVISEILSNSQAAMIPLLNGKHTFVIDGGEKNPKDLFTQHNTWDFVWAPNIGRLTEAIRVSYTDNSDYTKNELTVYWYDGAVHEAIKEGTTDEDYLLVKKDLKYVNDRSSVLKLIKYELETIQTKRDNFELKCNLEGLNLQLYDRVHITNTANMQNEQTGLIKEVINDGKNITGFKLSAPVEIAENSQMVVRSLDYEHEQPLVNIFTVTKTGVTDIVNIEPVPFNPEIRGACEIKGLKDTWHYDGDLFAIGQGTIYDCIITDIRYREDCTATITARNY